MTYATTPEEPWGGDVLNILTSGDVSKTSKDDAFVEKTRERNKIERAERGQILDLPPGKYQSMRMAMLALDSIVFETALPDGRKEPLRWFADTLFMTRDNVAVNGGTWDGSFMLESTCWVVTCL